MKRRLFILTALLVFFLSNIAAAQDISFEQETTARDICNPPRPQPNWKDSYKANGLCWCDTNYDHGLAGKKLKINGTNYGIKQVCNELKKHPKYRKFKNGDIPYNDIQCGHGPKNNAPDEACCPGQVNIGTAGCNNKGPTFDMNWLRSRSIFGGNGDGNNGGNNGGSVTIKGQSINKFLSTNMVFNSGNANGNQQKFSVQSTGSGTVSIKANNGKYVSSENGTKRMTANRNAVGAWEKFTLVPQSGNNVYAIRGNNGKYVSHENGNGAANCNRGAIGLWEKFVITGLSNREFDDDKELEKNINVYPNPALSAADINLDINLEKDALTTIQIMDVTGKVIAQKNMGTIKAGSTSITMKEFGNSLETSGLYLIKINLDNSVITKRIMVQ